MDFFPTTALHVVGAIDCSLLSRTGATSILVGEFLDITQDRAGNALLMGESLGLLRRQNPKAPFIANGLLPQILVSCSAKNRPCVFRLALEQYEPFRIFAHRLAQSHTAQEAARAVKSVAQLDAHRDEIANTLSDLGTYSNSLRIEAGGLLTPRGRDDEGYLSVTSEVMDDRQTALLFVTKRIGTRAAQWVDPNSVFEPLVTAYQRSANAHSESRAPIVHAANAVESFLEQFSAARGVSLGGAAGINAKAQALRSSQPPAITTKHLNLMKYLGHVRNAADHGIDPETNQPWEISETTAHEYVHVAMTAISSLVSFHQDTYRI